MKVHELLELLEDVDPEATVRLATQPNWPLQFEVRGVATAADIALEGQCEEHDAYNCEECSAEQDAVVYLVEGDHPDGASPYAPRAAWTVADNR
jgi:hypothetical protein